MIPRVGMRVEVTAVMPQDPSPIEVGARGTVVGGDEEFGQIWVNWDDGRSLILLSSDPFRVLSGS